MNVSIAVNDCVDFAIKYLLKCHGITQKDFVDWGGVVDEVVRPSNPHRREGIISGELDMVIDEGMDSWGDVAVEHGMKFLSYSEPVLQRLEKFGFQRARLDHGRIDGINDPTTVVDFSGWPIVVHEKFPDDLAYHIAGVLEKIREEIPYDATETPSMKQLCSNTESGPLDFPLHPGAERYYREKGICNRRDRGSCSLTDFSRSDQLSLTTSFLSLRHERMRSDSGHGPDVTSPWIN